VLTYDVIEGLSMVYLGLDYPKLESMVLYYLHAKFLLYNNMVNNKFYGHD